MDTLESRSIINPHWMMRLLGEKKAILSISSDGLILERVGRKAYALCAENLKRGNILRRGMFFSRLVLPTDRGEQQLRGLGKSELEGFFDFLQDYQYWLEEYQRLALDIRRCAAKINRFLHMGYLRHSRWLKLRSTALGMLHRFHKVPAVGCLNPNRHPDFTLLQQIVHWNEEQVEDFRTQYVIRLRERFSNYFERVETKPLTQRQRDACVIDEDNNLVLAGAGTGKTSIMIGRAGFLIRSGQTYAKQILMLAYAKKAAQEMQKRLDERVATKGVVASTFHKLGKDIIASVEKIQPTISSLAEDRALLAKHVDEWFEELLTIPSYRDLFIDYLSYYKDPPINRFDFETEGDYLNWIKANNIRTLKGERVKGMGECQIANRLLKLGIAYKYEADYEHVTRGANYRQYQPDFYLPDYGIYLEHWGIDRNGNSAPFVDREKYREAMDWKRKLHEKHGTRLIETYHYQYTEGRLCSVLNEKLRENKVIFKPQSSKEILEKLREFGELDNFTPLLTDLLRAYKGSLPLSNRVHKEVIQKSDHLSQTRQKALEIVIPIYEKYEAFLKENQHIDFDDMIVRAIEYVESGRFVSHWRYILVDEFQDISKPRARLLKALRESVDMCSLFCVGDDWQSIYHFTGSDIRFTTEFEKRFGHTKVTILDKTFRLNNSICDIASRFVLENPMQMKKSLLTHRRVKHPAVSLLRQKKGISSKESDFDDRLNKVLAHIAAHAKKGSSVYLLGRFHSVLPNHAQILPLRNRFPTLTIKSHTFHGVKGLEADYVVVLELECGEYGFPSQKTYHPLLKVLLPPLDLFPHSEERRLFYVALTRAKQRVYLISDMMNASAFLLELLNKKYPLALDEFETTLEQASSEHLHCIECRTGRLVPVQGKHFYSCSNYPLCKHTENGCQKCRKPMQRIERFKVCLDPHCSSWLPLCLKCGADMVRRKSSHGVFWGCKNFRGSDEDSCLHTENHIFYASKRKILTT